MYTESKKSSPRQRRHEVTREKILAEARKIMVEKGLNGLSIRGLAEATDYSPAAIYKYFDSKEQILTAIRDEGWTLANSMMATAASVPHLAPPQRLLESGLTFLKFADTYPEHYQLMFNTPDLPSRGPGEVGGDPNFTGLVDTVADGLAQGYFHLPEGYTPLLMAFHLWISSHGMAMLKQNLMRGNRAEFDHLCETLIRLYVQAITTKKDQDNPTA
jgi:AcrR family transcriptional regulator